MKLTETNVRTSTHRSTGERLNLPLNRMRRNAITAAALLIPYVHSLAADLVFDATAPSITTSVTADNSLWVGVNNPNVNLTIESAGSVTVPSGSHSATVGLNPPSDGNTLTVRGLLTVGGNNVNVGYSGSNNTLLVESGGDITASNLNVGGVAGSTGNALTVNGSGSTVILSNNLNLGYATGNNTFRVEAGGQVSNLAAEIGVASGGDGNTATVTGSGSSWTSTDLFYLGSASSANSLTISSGGLVQANTKDLVIGLVPGANSNSLLVTGSGSQLTNTGQTLYVGRSGNTNTLEIRSGGLVSGNNVRIGGGSGATGNPTGNSATVDGTGSTWNISGTLRVGSGTATSDTSSSLTVTNGGAVSVTGNGFLGYSATSTSNSILVSGLNSALSVAGAGGLTIGNAAGSTNNVVILDSNGTLTATNGITLGQSSGLQIGSGGAAGSIASPISISGARTGSFVKFNHSATSYTFASSLAGTLEVSHIGSGSTKLTGTNSYSGPTSVTGGTLTLNGVSATSAISVGTGAVLAIEAGQTATTSGNYTQNAGGTFQTNATNSSTFGKLSVAGTAILPSTTNIRVVSGNNCSGISEGQVLASVISATTLDTTTNSSTYNVTDDCTDVSFVATKVGQSINLTSTIVPSCGSANTQSFSIPPSANLCSPGSASSVTSSAGQYSWTCSGSLSTTPASCTANWVSTGGTGTGTVTAPLPAANNNWVLTNATVSSSLPATAPSGYVFPNGSVSLQLTTGDLGSEARVTINYSEAVPAGAVYMKYGRSPEGFNCSGAACLQDHWYQMPVNKAVFAPDRKSVTLTIQDGGVGDNDLTADRSITDPGGPAVLNANAASIPTLSEWGMITLSALLALGAFGVMRRRKI